MIPNNTYSEEDLIYFKKQYNYVLERSKNSEEFFKNNSVSKCIKYLDLFNEVTRELGELISLIEDITGEELDYDTKINGFKEVRT